MASQSNLVLLDLKQILKDLDDHCDPSQVNEYVAYCPCGEPVGQDTNKCPVCDRWTVWLNSDVWDQKFRVEAEGDPAAALLLNHTGVIPKSKIKQWYNLRATVGDDVLLRIAHDVAKWTKKDRKPRSSIIPRVIALAKKETRKHVQVPQPNNDDVIPDLNL